MRSSRRPSLPHLVSLLAICVPLVAACGDDGPSFTDARPIDADQTDGGNIGPPGPITSFAAVTAAENLDLSWVLPGDTDLAGVLIVAGAGVPVTFAPANGTSYDVTAVVGTDQVVIHTSLDTTLAGVPTIPGLDVHFAAWAFDTEGLYSPIATTDGRNDTLGPQTGIIQVFQDGTVVVTQQPRWLRLSGTAVYDDPGDAFTVQLAVENQTNRILFNLKGLVESSSQGTVTNRTFPISGGLPMAYYGPEGTAIGAAPARQLDLTGIDGSMDPVVLTMRFVDAPSVLVSAADAVVTSVDSAGSGAEAMVDLPNVSCVREESRGGALSPDAHFLYTGARSEARIHRIDLTTLVLSSSALVTTAEGVGSITALALSADGTRLYAVLHDGRHAGGGKRTGECGGTGAAATTRLVEVDASTLVELRRLELGPEGALGTIAIVAGNRAVITVDDSNRKHTPGLGLAYVVDLTAWSVVDTDAGTAGTQPLALTGAPNGVIVPGADGTSFTIPVAVTGGFRVDTFDSATLSKTSVMVDAADSGRAVGLRRDAGGGMRLLYRHEPDGAIGASLVTISGSQQSSAMIMTDGRADALVFSRDGTRYYVPRRNGVGAHEVAVFDATTDLPVDMDGDSSNGITGLPTTTPVRHHGLAMLTPF